MFQIQIPSALGLNLNKFIEFDSVFLKMITSKLLMHYCSARQQIASVGEMDLGDDAKVLRFYTSERYYVQMLFNGDYEEKNIAEVKLFYRYAEYEIHNNNDLNYLLEEDLATPECNFKHYDYKNSWGLRHPIVGTETVYSPHSKIHQSHQIFCLYERPVTETIDEFLLKSVHERKINGEYQYCSYIHCGINLLPDDFKVLGE